MNIWMFFGGKNNHLIAHWLELFVLFSKEAPPQLDAAAIMPGIVYSLAKHHGI